MSDNQDNSPVDPGAIAEADATELAALAGKASDEDLAAAMSDAPTRKKILDEIFGRMADHADPAQIKDVDAIVQFKINDAPGGGVGRLRGRDQGRLDHRQRRADHREPEDGDHRRPGPLPEAGHRPGIGPDDVHDGQAQDRGGPHVRLPHDELLPHPERRLALANSLWPYLGALLTEAGVRKTPASLRSVASAATSFRSCPLKHRWHPSARRAGWHRPTS